MAIGKHVRAVLLLPFVMTVVIPAALLYFVGPDTLGLWNRFPISRFFLPALGVIFVGIGLRLMIATLRLFATVGQGTLAPWDPTQKLIVRGVYRHVRNPMICGAILVLVGEAVGFASLPLLGWSGLFILAHVIFIPLVEEPDLVRRFGAAYEEYRRHVPRWLPRRKPWDPVRKEIGR